MHQVGTITYTKKITQNIPITRMHPGAIRWNRGGIRIHISDENDYNKRAEQSDDFSWFMYFHMRNNYPSWA